MSDIEKQALDAVYAEIEADEKARAEVWARELAYVKENSDFDFERLDFSDLDFAEHVGYVEVEPTDYKESGYSSYQFYVEKGNPMSGHYMRQDDDGAYHELVRQWSVGESGDSWAGYILYPLKDGRYWKVEFSC